uniref:Vacuolar protein sorting-associated protein 51 homolog n=1 Tax=Caenorhabditis tropicalis TaxID=1561998 RepID=A0A1I7TJQ0_9PELO
MPSAPLAESSKKTLHEVKKFAEVVYAFAEKIKSGPPGEQRLIPIVLFVKNYLRHYSTALIDQVIDIEFKNSLSYFERSYSALMDAFVKLNNSYLSVFQDEQSEF